MRTIAIVEDSQVISSIYRSKLQKEGFAVELATDGLAGLELVRRTKPDLLLLDLVLPKLDGVEVIRRLRSEPQFAKLPIIVLSTAYWADLVKDAWAAGATKVLSKATHDPKEVVGAVKEALAGGSPAAGPT